MQPFLVQFPSERGEVSPRKYLSDEWINSWLDGIDSRHWVCILENDDNAHILLSPQSYQYKFVHAVATVHMLSWNIAWKSRNLWTCCALSVCVWVHLKWDQHWITCTILEVFRFWCRSAIILVCIIVLMVIALISWQVLLTKLINSESCSPIHPKLQLSLQHTKLSETTRVLWVRNYIQLIYNINQ